MISKRYMIPKAKWEWNRATPRWPIRCHDQLRTAESLKRGCLLLLPRPTSKSSWTSSISKWLWWRNHSRRCRERANKLDSLRELPLHKFTTKVSPSWKLLQITDMVELMIRIEPGALAPTKVAIEITITRPQACLTEESSTSTIQKWLTSLKTSPILISNMSPSRNQPGQVNLKLRITPREAAHLFMVPLTTSPRK